MRYAVTGLVCRLMALTMVCWPAAVAAGRSPSAEELRAVILVKALGYERSIASGEGPLTIATVVPEAGAAAAGAADMFKALSAVSAGSIEGRAVRVIKVSDTPQNQIAVSVRRSGAEVLYLPRGTGELAERLAHDLSSYRGLIACGNPGRVGRGCMLSVESRKQGQRLVIDVTRAQRAGFTFDARLLRLSRVVR